jgi:putative hydrolase of the HAD superfamily
VPIEALTFDVGQTLIEPWPSVGHVYAQVAARHGVQGLSADLLDRRFATAWRALKEFNYTRAEWAALVDETFRGLAPALPSLTFFAELYAHFAQPEAWRVFPDVRPALDAAAARGLKLGIVSNWDDRLRPLLQRLKLYDAFDAVVVSCEVGAPKPAPAIFHHAARLLGLPPAAILHVGDSLELDAEAARAAGFQAVQLCRNAPDRATGRIQSLAQLPGCLERATRGGDELI